MAFSIAVGVPHANLPQTPRANRVFSITELQRDGTGQLVDSGVKFVWDAATQTAPRGGWECPSEIVTTRADYPGSTQPTEQGIAFRYLPFTLEGAWDDRYAGTDFAWDTFVAFEALIARFSFVRLQFEQLSITGLITGFKPQYIRKNYIRWSFTFSPHFRVENGLQPIPDSKRAPQARATTKDMTDAALQAASALSDAVNDLPAELPSKTLAETYSEVVEKVVGIVSKANEAAQVADSTVFGPIEQISQANLRLAQSMLSIRSSAFDLVTTVGGIVSNSALAFDHAMDALNLEVWFRESAASARDLIVASDASASALQERNDGRIMRTYTPHAGENLYAISNRFYGTPDGWRRIADANDLDYVTLTGSEVLLIPELR